MLQEGSDLLMEREQLLLYQMVGSGIRQHRSPGSMYFTVVLEDYKQRAGLVGIINNLEEGGVLEAMEGS